MVNCDFDVDLLSSADIERYQHHLQLDEMGPAGQLKLKNASILIVGLGGLGSSATLYLAAAGVGRMGLVEFDVIETSNLQRQILYSSDQIGLSKMDCAVERLRALNPDIQIERYDLPLDPENARGLVSRYDYVIDGVDNFATHYLLNDVCALQRKPLIAAAISGFEGQLSVFNFQNGPCYRCLYPQPPPATDSKTCVDGGVLGVLAGVMGALQATEVIKLILGKGESARGRLIRYDALKLELHEFVIQRNPACLVCGDGPVAANTMAESKSLLPVEISVEELIQLQKKTPQIIFIDVRNERPLHERSGELGERALHIPFSDLLTQSFDLDQDASIVVYCQSGEQGVHATLYLRSLGFSHVQNLKGGLQSWHQRETGKIKSLRDLRSFLFVPLSERRPLTSRAYKRATATAHALILDLEDSVTARDKVAARGLLAEAVDYFAQINPHILVRVNSDANLQADLRAVAATRALAVVLPKVDRLDQLLQARAFLRELQSLTTVIPLFETARGILNCQTIVNGLPELECVFFGSEDLAAQLRVTDPTPQNMLYAAQHLLLVCAAENISVVGAVGAFSAFHLKHRLEFAKIVELSKQIGFSGSFAIHPHQVTTINEIFSGPSERARLQAIVDQSSDRQAVFSYDGRLYGPPMIKRYKQILNGL